MRPTRIDFDGGQRAYFIAFLNSATVTKPSLLSSILAYKLTRINRILLNATLLRTCDEPGVALHETTMRNRRAICTCRCSSLSDAHDIALLPVNRLELVGHAS